MRTSAVDRWVQCPPRLRVPARCSLARAPARRGRLRGCAGMHADAGEDAYLGDRGSDLLLVQIKIRIRVATASAAPPPVPSSAHVRSRRGELVGVRVSTTPGLPGMGSVAVGDGRRTASRELAEHEQFGPVGTTASATTAQPITVARRLADCFVRMDPGSTHPRFGEYLRRHPRRRQSPTSPWAGATWASMCKTTACLSAVTCGRRSRARGFSALPRLRVPARCSLARAPARRGCW